MGNTVTRIMTTCTALAVLVAVGIPETASAFALITGSIPNCDFASGSFGTDCVPSFIAHVIQQIFTLTGALSLIAIMWGGYEYAFGNLIGGKEKGMARVRWGVTGMIISAFSLFILSFVAKSIAT